MTTLCKNRVCDHCESGNPVRMTKTLVCKHWWINHIVHPFFILLASSKSHQRWLALGTVLVSGLLFGVVQQLRGAHFISHDLWTLVICWFVAAFYYPLMLVPKDALIGSGYLMKGSTSS